MAVDFAHVVGSFLDHSNGNAIAAGQVTANAKVLVPSGVYGRTMEGGVYLVGYRTLHKGDVSQVHRALWRSSVPARPSRIQ